jgi:hypothetical protein
MNCRKDMLDLDFRLTACVIFKCLYRGQRPHSRPLCTKGVEGYGVSAGLVEGGWRAVSCAHKGREEVAGKVA